MENKNYRVLIVEPSIIIRQGLAVLFSTINNFEIVGSLSDMHRIDERIADFRADIVLLNPSLIDFHKHSAVRNIFPDTIVVALAYIYTDSEFLRQFNAVIDICDDSHRIENKLSEALSNIHQSSTSVETDDLSDREKEILVAVARGMMNKEIAILHNISIHTVISHRKNISRKTGIKSVSGLTVYALLNNLIEQNDIQ